MTASTRALALRVRELGEYVHAHGPYLPSPIIDGWLAWVAAWERFASMVEDSPAAEASAAELDAFERQLGDWREQLERVVGLGAAQVGDWLPQYISPSRARARMDSVNAEVRSLDEHIQARRGALGDAFVHAWEGWRGTWRAFYGGYDRDWDWWTLGNASAWNETLVFQERLTEWRAAAERAGVTFSTPRPQTAPERREDPRGGVLGSARDIAIAGAVGVVALGGIYVLSKL